MNVLGFDTSTAATAVCLLRSDGKAFEVEPEPAALSGPPRHGRELMPRIAQLMETGELSFGELGAIAVGVGPGTFTGLRIGVATARALAQAESIPLRPVSSLAALAAGIPGNLVLPLIDARRGELFAALYERGRLRWAPFTARPEAVVERLRTHHLAPVAAGDGSLRSRQGLEAAGVEVLAEGSRSHVVRALHMCRLAGAEPAVPPEAVLPQYLRAPDAQRAR